MIEPEQAASLKLFVVLSKAYKAIMEQAIKDMKRHGLTPTEFMIMEILYHKGKVPLQQFAHKILMTSGSITYNIDKLAGKNLLRRVPCQDDRRVTYAEITDEGRQLFDRIFPIHTEAIHDVMEGLGLEDKEAATELLKRLGKAAQA